MINNKPKWKYLIRAVSTKGHKIEMAIGKPYAISRAKRKGIFDLYTVRLIRTYHDGKRMKRGI